MEATFETRFLAEIVKTPSPSGFEDAAASLFAKRLKDLGWETIERDEVGNVVARRGNGPKELVLLGHIDTVQGGPDFRLDGGTMHGRGTVDAKGPLCALAVAGGRAGIPGEWKVTLIAAVGEETDSRGARHRVALHRPSACIVGEPTGTDGIALAYRGRILARLFSKDGGAHRSWSPGPPTAVVLAAAEILGAVGVSGSTPGISSRNSGAVLSMHGEETQGRIAELFLDIRVAASHTPESLTELVMEISDRHDVSAKILDSVPYHGVNASDPVAGAIRNALRRAGTKPRFLKKSGTSDFNTVASWGCPMAVYGPGRAELEHTSEERIETFDYIKSIEILERAITNISHMPRIG